MFTLPEVKTWLRLEESDTAEDALLQTLIDAATEYIRNAVPPGMVLDRNPQAKLLAQVLVADWYEHREAIGQVREELRPTVRALVLQLQTAYPVIETASLPDGVVGVPYAATLTAGGGAPPYKWSMTQGTLPAGLTLDPATGQITGTPTEQGTFQITVKVEDSNVPPKVGIRPLTLVVVGP